MKEKVFITGGSSLLALGWSISVKDKFDVVLGLHNRGINLAGTQSVSIDLGSVDTICTVFENIKPDIVIHTVALTDIEACEHQPEMAHYTNVTLSTNVARACHILDIELVHISTDHIFSGDSSLADETMKPCPLNVYAKTKVEAEKHVLDIHSGTLVIRTNFFGWGMSYRRSYSDLILEHLTKKVEIVLFDNVYYTPILIQSLAEAVHELIDIQAKGIINVVGNEKISKFEFGLKLAKQFNLDSRFICMGRLEDKESLVQRPHDMSLSNEKAKKLLGRDIGMVDESIALLYQQRKNGLYRKLQQL